MTNDIWLVTTKNPIVINGYNRLVKRSIRYCEICREDWDFLIEARFNSLKDAEDFARKFVLEHEETSDTPIELMISKYVTSFKAEAKPQAIQFYDHELCATATIRK